MNIEALLYQFGFSNVWFKPLMCNFDIRNLKTQNVNLHFIV